MAFPDGDDLDRRARRRRDRRMPSPEDENDWSAGSEYRRHPLPYRKRPVEREMLESAGSRPSIQRRSREPSFQPEPAAMAPVTRRPSAVPRRARDPLVYEQTSGTDSRRSSRKDYSPRYHISTPGSKRSSHTTVSDSDEGSTWTPSTQDDDRGRRSLERYRPSPRKELSQRRARRSGGRRSKLAVPLVPELEVVEDEEESSEEEEEEEEEDDDDDADEDESEEEDTEEDEVETEPRLKARLGGPRMPEEDITSRSPLRPRFTYRTRDRHRGPPPPLSEDHYRPSPPRRPLGRTHGSDIVLVKPTTIRRSNTIGGSYTPSSLTTSTRRSSIFDSFRPRSARTSYEREEKIGTCAACYEETPSRKTVKLGCGHRMCNSCLKHLFRLSVADPQHMPPRCCCKEHIPLKHVERLFDRNFKNTFERKFAEHSTRSQLYCPSKRCGEPILPGDIYEDRGRKCAQCNRCGTKICGACNERWHSLRECPAGEATNETLEQPRDEGAQRCYRCRNIVESMDGCNRMTCRCGAQFCMNCGRKWGRCNCPLFNEETMEPDDLDERIPVPTLTRSETFPRSPPLRQYRGRGPPTTRPLAPLDFEEEIPVRPHRDRRDPDLARRFERLAPRESTQREITSRGRDRPRGKGRELIDEPVREPLRDDDDYDFYDDDYDGYDFDEDGEYRGSVEDDLDRTPPRRRRGQDGFRRGEDTVVPPSPPAAPQGYDRTAKTADYVSGVSKARGVRGSSMERRLADRFSPQRATPRRKAPAHAHSHRPQHELVPMPPMVSMPPPMVPPAPSPIARRHTAEEDMYNMVRARPAVLGRGQHDYVEQIPSRRHSDEMLTAQSAMAGLNGAGRGMNRVMEWMDHVEPGPPEEEAPAHRRRPHY